jgi:hypothetical protein
MLFEKSHAEAAAAQSIPNEWESYLDRPDILKTEARTHSPVGNWEALKAAHFSFVAELLSFYPSDTHFYFLARDSEHLFDVARLVTDGTEEAKRIHLINVSRGNMRDKNIKAYLGENGISDASLNSGKKVLFVDTGFSGTIPRVIGELFSADIRMKLKTHLVVSSNPDHPSSRAFLVHLNSSVNSQDPSGMHGTVISYEHLPRYTDRSSSIVYSEGRYHPVSRVGTASDGSVSKEVSQMIMADLRNEWQKTEVKTRFNEERAAIVRIMKLLKDSDGGKKLKIELEEKQNSSEGRLLEAIVRDILEAKRNSVTQPVAVNLEELGLKPAQPGSSSQTSKKNELIEKFPEWAPVLENPDAKVPELFTEKNWQSIGNLIDANVDIEFNRILIKSLYDAPASGIKKDLQKLMIAKGDVQSLRYIARHVFSKPHATGMKDLIRLAIEKGNADANEDLALYSFSKPHAAEMKELIRLLIEKGDPMTMVSLAQSTFSNSHTADMKDLIGLMISKSNDLTLRALARFTFSQPHTAQMTDLVRLVIDKGDEETLRILDQSIFSKPHAQTPEHQVLKRSLEIHDATKRKAWIDTELAKISSPNSADIQTRGSTNKAPDICQVSSSLNPGDVVMVKNRALTVLKNAGEGRRGVVFQVRADNGALYALKTAKNEEPDTLQSLAAESKKAAQWQELKIPHAEVLVQEKNFVLKPWIEGIRGDAVIEKFLAGNLAFKPAAERILSLVTKIRDQGAYIGDFRPANLIWSGTAWIIIDSGSIQQGMTLADARAKWARADERGPKFERRWKMPLPPLRCVDIFMGAGKSTQSVIGH